MKKTLFLILITLFLTLSAFSLTLTDLTVSATSLQILTATTVTADATYSFEYPKYLQKGLAFSVSATSGTITFFAGEFTGNVYGDYVVVPATSTVYGYYPDSMRFLKFDGTIDFKVEGLTNTLIYLLATP